MSCHVSMTMCKNIIPSLAWKRTCHFYFQYVREANSGVSKDVFLMFQVHHPVCQRGESRGDENTVWKALQL